VGYRAKNAVGILIFFAAIFLLVVSGFLFGNLGAMPPARVVPIVFVMFAIAVCLRFAYVRTIRCPNCSVRFGIRNYMSGIMGHPWPNKRCWKCGADMDDAERKNSV
jgi:DNA-directed RNA polymerase subunit RPC12/RpoP